MRLIALRDLLERLEKELSLDPNYETKYRCISETIEVVINLKKRKK